MQITPLTYEGPGFLITSCIPVATSKEFLGIHFQPDAHSYRFFLSSNLVEEKEERLHIYYAIDYLQRHKVVIPILNDEHGKMFQANPAIATVIVNILQCNLSAHTASLYYEAKALELLTLVHERISLAEISPLGLKLSPGDIEMLEKARDILVSDFENIPIIKQLARKVGTNDFKLKKAFKQHFGSSVFAYVQDVRLENARKLLVETDHPITDIAYMTGYNHCNNFSVAFKRKFGVGVKFYRDQKERELSINSS